MGEADARAGGEAFAGGRHRPVLHERTTAELQGLIDLEPIRFQRCTHPAARTELTFADFFDLEYW